jgi:hypothetical protein
MDKNATDDIATVSSLYAPVFNFSTLHAMSHRSDFVLACCSDVDISKAVFYLIRMYPLTATQIKLP